MQYAVSKPLPRPVSLHIFLPFQSFFSPSFATKRQEPQTAKAFGVRVVCGGCGRAVKNNKSISLSPHPLHGAVYIIHI